MEDPQITPVAICNKYTAYVLQNIVVHFLHLIHVLAIVSWGLSDYFIINYLCGKQNIENVERLIRTEQENISV